MSATAAPRHRPARPRKAETIELRLAAEAKALVAEAARVAHTSLSEFVLSSALRQAEETLAGQRVFQVSDEHWSAFMDILSGPAEPDADIVALARSRPPWAG